MDASVSNSEYDFEKDVQDKILEKILEYDFIFYITCTGKHLIRKFNQNFSDKTIALGFNDKIHVVGDKIYSWD